jgi:hypothetical protein
VGLVIVVVSQAWTLDAHLHADAYISGSKDFESFLERHPGYVGRRLLRSLADPTHFTNMRFFLTLEDYHDLITWDGYRERIMALGEHLQPADTYPREYMEVVLGEESLPGLVHA